MNKSGDLGSFSGQLTSIPKKATDQLVKEPIEAVEEVGEQAGIKPTASSTTNASDEADTLSQKDTLEIVKKMYEKSDTKTNVPSDKIISEVINENPKKTPEEIQKLATTRQQLLQQQHKSTYYDPTFNPAKRQEERRPAEEIEKEEQEKNKMEALEFQKQEKKKKELSPAVKQGTHEKYPGAAG